MKISAARLYVLSSGDAHACTETIRTTINGASRMIRISRAEKNGSPIGAFGECNEQQPGGERGAVDRTQQRDANR
jgi:hypothetical protein